MKGSALLETMARQVDEVYENNLSAARATVETILEETRQECASMEESTLQATSTEMDALAERWRQKADTEAAKAALSVQNDAVRAVLDRVQDEIRTLVTGEGFQSILDSLLHELMAAAEAEVVALAPEDHVDYVRGWLKKNGFPNVPVEGSSSMWDGVAIQDRDRTFRISNTLTGRFSRVEQNARRICSIALFGAHAEGAE